MTEKCNTCMLRYPCDERTEWNCKENGYRHYEPDASKIKMLKDNATTVSQKSLRPRELKDTIALMTSADYKERFRAEYWQVKIRHDKLAVMLEKYERRELDFEPTCSPALLRYQLSTMGVYLDALIIRATVEGIDLGEEAGGE